MTEEDLISLGFERTDVSAEESGSTPYYFYSWDLASMSFGLITQANDEVKNGKWYVKIFNIDEVVIHDRDDVEHLISIVRNNSQPHPSTVK